MDGTFNTNPALSQAVEAAKKNNSALHIIGLLSPGGVHSHEDHMHAMVEMAARSGLKKIYVHAILDGRDTPPRSAEHSLQRMQDKCTAVGAGRIATIIGRFFALDRDNRWDRVQQAYDLMTQGKAPLTAKSASEALEQAYARDENDEFVQATVIGEKVMMQDGDAAVFMNFRADRARELTRALTDTVFDGFKREHFPKLASFVTLSSYGEDFHLPTAFAPGSISNGFGEYISGLGLKQLRIAETEKYAHVTYFLNGGKEQPYPGEERIMVPSPKVKTYDLKPEMSAFEVTDKLEEAIRSGQYQSIICNYANGDMVGHSGNLAAATKAIEALDICIGRVVTTMQQCGGEVLITADHGNAEQMLDRATHQAHTAHTLNLVPFIYVGRKATIAKTGALQDIAPTMLSLMGLPKPTEMTGTPLLTLL
jgi:2,3-bisphosphoglycerate-independent phosphoglycerate mutase